MLSRFLQTGCWIDNKEFVQLPPRRYGNWVRLRLMTIKRTAQKGCSNLTLICYAKTHSEWKNANTLFPSYLKGYSNPNLYWHKLRSANHKSKNFKLYTRWDYRTSLYQTYCVFDPFSFVKNLNNAKHSSSLFFKEISKNGTRSYCRMFASAKKKQQK